ncbi:TPA: hypothetical protein ACOEF8_004062 [Enterobacter roggenkampii]
MKGLLIKSMCLMCFLFSVILVFPFLNGIGCNFKIKILNSPFGDFYGVCEGGVINGVVKDSVSDKLIKIKARYGIVGARFYIYVYNEAMGGVIAANSNAELQTRNRKFNSGRFVKTDGGVYIYYSLPEPVIYRVFLQGKLGII